MLLLPASYSKISRLILKEMSDDNICRVAVCQMTSCSDKDKNFKTVEELVKAAQRQMAKMCFLPEACDFITDDKSSVIDLAETLDGSLMTKYKKLAQLNDMWLSLGGIHEKTSLKKVSNSHVLIDPNGIIKKVYRKTHLFDVDLPDKGIYLKESDYVEQGAEIAEPVKTPIGNLGLGICYDLRFPEFSLSLANMGADVLTYPAAFLFTTGSAHWEVLLRARAIETQTYVIAAAQTGEHHRNRMSWGHAMVVDPWGTIIAQCSEGTCCSVAEINLKRISTARINMPVMRQRRYDLYPKLQPQWKRVKPDRGGFQFGQSYVDVCQVFLQTEMSFAFTNIRPVVCGHVLVSPIRCVKRYSELNHEEIKDIWITVQKVQSIVEKINNVHASTVVIQDGADAGQTVEHVHVHILPRRPGDFKRNDDVYDALQHKDYIPSRTMVEMALEAESLRQCLPSLQ